MHSLPGVAGPTHALAARAANQRACQPFPDTKLLRSLIYSSRSCLVASSLFNSLACERRSFTNFHLVVNTTSTVRTLPQSLFFGLALCLLLVNFGCCRHAR
jgi:hypothetical protein